MENDALKGLFILQELHQGPFHLVVTLGRDWPRKLEGKLRIFMVDIRSVGRVHKRFKASSGIAAADAAQGYRYYCHEMTFKESIFHKIQPFPHYQAVKPKHAQKLLLCLNTSNIRQIYTQNDRRF